MEKRLIAWLNTGNSVPDVLTLDPARGELLIALFSGKVYNGSAFDFYAITDLIGYTDQSFNLKRYAHVFENQRKAAAMLLLKIVISTQN
jgi:hypothetical protein